MSNNPFHIPNIPWEERSTHSSDVIWRYSANPIIPRDLIPTSNSIFNSAVVPFEDKFAGVFRCDNKKREMNLHVGLSDDAINWTLGHDPIEWMCDEPKLAPARPRSKPQKAGSCSTTAL